MTQSSGFMERVFLPSLAIPDTLQANACRFWDNQDKILDSMETFANGWFERRRAGTRAALEAAQCICKARTSADLVREYQGWASGVFERVMADGLACQQQLVELAGALAGPPAPVGGEQQSEPSQSEPRTFTRSKAA